MREIVCPRHPRLRGDDGHHQPSMAFPTAYEDSDADDEYERSVVSPPLVTDSETSPTDSDPPSTENTPTLYGQLGDDKSPRNIITDWSAEECAEYVSSLGLSQYADAFLGEKILVPEERVDRG